MRSLLAALPAPAVVLACAVLLAPAAPLAAQADGPPAVYRVIKLPSHLPTQGASGAQLNEDRVVVGSGIESGWFQGVIWPEPSTAVDMEAALGFEHSFGYAIDDAGTWVGSASLDATLDKESIVVQAPGQAPVFLPQLVEDPGIRSGGFDIADNGLIAGSCDTVPTVGLSGDPQTRATLWEDGVPRNLGKLEDGNVSLAYGVNQSKLVVGVSNLTPGNLIHAFAWTESTGMVPLPGLSAAGRSVARDVNEAGLIVGDADGPAGRLPVVWPDLDTIVTLPVIPNDFLPGANAVNAHGQIVGSASGQFNVEGRLWQGGHVHDIGPLVDDPQVRIFSLTDINDDGVILAQGFDLTQDPILNTAMLLVPDLLFGELGFGLAGTHGEPTFDALGNLLPGGPVHLRLGNALAGAPAFLAVGATPVHAPFAGGTLVPAFMPPGGLLIPLFTNGAGEIALTGTWPAALPPGFQAWYQFWVKDAGGPSGWAASPALRSVTP
jgi:uncharacterized membrane protein